MPLDKETLLRRRDTLARQHEQLTSKRSLLISELTQVEYQLAATYERGGEVESLLSQFDQQQPDPDAESKGAQGT
ncbi:MAG: hypothetical protein DMF64_18835 [Acidobacteria bacterium]|nr:MAG: hypothetical protein DMF64_18835 [Acidobacteriota bacterium]